MADTTAPPPHYPKWLYHTDGRSCEVATPAEEATVKEEAGWGDQPSAEPPPDPAPVDESEGVPEPEVDTGWSRRPAVPEVDPDPKKKSRR